MFNKIIRNIPVLCYHDMSTPGGHDLEAFKKHLDVIQELGFQTITASHLYDIITGQKKLNGKYIVLTFDDCHISNWVYTIPLLARLNMHGVFFAVTDFIETAPPREPESIRNLAKLSHAFRMALKDNDYSQFMNLGELKAAIQDFGMEVYSHTSRHQGCFINLQQTGTVATNAHWSIYGIYNNPQPEDPVFKIGSAYAYNGYWPEENVQCSTEAPINSHEENNFQTRAIKLQPRSDEERYKFCLNDFKRSYELIKEINKSNLQLFCWPWGHFDKLCTQALKEAGFHGAFTLERFRNGPGTNPFRIHRIGVGRKKDEKWLRNRLLMHGTSIGSIIFFKFFRKKAK